MNTINYLINLYNENITTLHLSVGILFLIPILFNILLLFSSKKHDNIKALSNMTTIFCFGFSLLFLLACYILNSNFATDLTKEINLFNDAFLINSKNIFMQISINIFLLLFTLTQLKTVSKNKTKTILSNLNLLLIGLFSNILTQSNIFILSYIIFEIIHFLTYKLASTYKKEQDKPFSIDFIYMSASASVLFFLFYLASLIIKDSLQLGIINVCICMSLLLKIGIFPIFNYSLNNQHKDNALFCQLLFGYIPFLGLLCFKQFLSNIELNNPIFQITISVFLMATMLSSAIFALKQKKIINFTIQTILSYYAFCFFYSLFSLNHSTIIFLAESLLLTYFGLYSLILLFTDYKQNIKTTEGLYYKNKFFTYLFIILLLILTNVLPSNVSISNLKEIAYIYSTSNTLYCAIIPLFLTNCLILINALNVIKSFFTLNLNNSSIALNKNGMKLNYFIPFSIIILLIIKIFI